ncbi:hypothetical protein ACFVTP_16775 [Streptomyces celluloflavus]|uniref:hypothetical protein n=1 Tax=Streptomyces celluloflavus TaxID=58344 RepID=UPI0036D9B1E1
MRRNTVGGLAAGVALAGALIGAAPAAQASTPGTMSLNCVNEYIGDNGSQSCYHVQCGVTEPTTWWANVACSNGSVNNTGPYNSFREVYVYCPAGTQAQRGWVTSNG